MWLVKSQIHYLRHPLSQDGISPFPEKLDAIRKMSPPQNIKELRQFFGLTGYYWNHNNQKHYADITNSLTKFLKKGEPYIQTEIHIKSFSELKNALHSPPIAIYLDPNKPYFLFTDASKYSWGTTICQHTSNSDPDSLQNLTPIMLTSVKFSKTQWNFAALVREAFAIYIFVKRLSFFLQDAKCTIPCDKKKNMKKQRQ